MNYILNSKNRKLKYKLHLLIDRLSFNFLNYTTSQKITFVGIIIAFVSLFLNWFRIEFDKVTTGSAFSVNSGYVGYIIFIILSFLLFLISSNQNKEKLKSKAHVVFYDYTIVIFSGIIIFLLTFVVFNTIKGFTTFVKSTYIGNGIVFEIVGSLFILVGGVLSYREKKQEILSKIYIENSKFEVQADLDEYKDILNPGQSNNKSNMSLPI